MLPCHGLILDHGINMTGPPLKRQKREEYRQAQLSSQTQSGVGSVDLPKKKFYRQRAHANPFSDHALI